jgi:ERCC4-related helicase
LPDLTSEVAAIDHALERLGLTRVDGALRVPAVDSRFHRVMDVATQHLRDGKQWKQDERLIIVTEYKTTLDYLFRRFKKEFQGDYESRIRILFGGKSQAGLMNRDEVIEAFNDAN